VKKAIVAEPPVVETKKSRNQSANDVSETVVAEAA